MVGVSSDTLLRPPVPATCAQARRAIGRSSGSSNVGPKDPVGKWPTLLDPLLVSLALMQRLQTLTGLPPATTMSLWTAVLDGRGIADPKRYPPNGPLTQAQSPYVQLFLNSATGPPNPAFLLNPDQSELADTSRTIAAELPAVTAALGLSAGDAALLAADALSGLPGGPEDLASLTLNLANLSVLYRCATLAKAMQLTTAEFLTLRAITDIDPFAAASLAAQLTPGDVPNPVAYLPAQANTLLFVEARDDIRATSMSLSQLAYVLGHITTPGEAITPTEQQVETILTDLQGVLVPIVQAHQNAPDPTGQLTLSQLSALPGLTDPDNAVAALNGTAVTDCPLAALPADLPDLTAQPLAYDVETAQLSFTAGAMSTISQTELKALSTDAAYQTAIDSLFTSSREPVASLLHPTRAQPANGPGSGRRPPRSG